LVDVYRERRYITYPGVQIREPTKLALIKKGYARRMERKDGVTNGWPLELTKRGEDHAKALIEGASNRLPDEPDPYENWESYD